MLTANELLIDGERLINNYNVEIARWRDDRWSSTIPPLYATLTNHRLILQPHSRKRLEPAVIPNRYLTNVLKMDKTHRPGVILCLQTGHQIALFVTNDPDYSLLDNLRYATNPNRPQRQEFKPSIDLVGIRKLIGFFADF